MEADRCREHTAAADGSPRALRRRPREACRKPAQSLKDRFGALRNLRPFIAMVWRTSPRLTLSSLLLRLVRALLPVVTLYIGKLIIDDVVLLLQVPARPATLSEWLASGRLNWLGLLLGAEFALAVLADVLGRIVVADRQPAGRARHQRVERAPDGACRDARPRGFRGRRVPGPARTRAPPDQRPHDADGQLFGQAQDMVTVASFAAGLMIYAPWLIVLLLVALVPAFLGEAHFNAQSYSLDFGRTPERRELDYVRQTAASVETAKEVKIFGLNGFLIERYRRTGARLLRRQPPARRAARRLGRAVHRHRHDRLLPRLCLYRLAHAGRRLLHRRPDLPRRLLPPAAHAARKPADGLLDGRRPGALPQRSVLLLRGRAGNPVAGQTRCPFPKPIREGFVFENVGFIYPGAERWAVRNLSFTLQAGEVLALVGENGAGKTTLVKLLTRLYDPDEGRILLDGHDLRDYDLDALRGSMGVIFQDFVRYNLTAGDNIAVGRIEARDDHDRISAGGAAQPGRRGDRAPAGGYDQMIGKRFKNGVELSGGEWQKIAIARAYMREAEVLILDEPTAALDARSEFEVFQRFKELSKGKTAILISHRFSSVRMADRILVLADGKVEAQGTHEELVAQGGRYAELFELQAAGYR